MFLVKQVVSNIIKNDQLHLDGKLLFHQYGYLRQFLNESFGRWIGGRVAI